MTRMIMKLYIHPRTQEVVSGRCFTSHHTLCKNLNNKCKCWCHHG